MPRSTALLVYPHTTQLLVATPTLVCPNYFQRSFASNDPGACGMQINALLRQVHHRVTLANDVADHKLEYSLNCSIHEDPTIQVGDKVLLHRPQSTIAQSSNLPWIGDFKVIKTNDVMSQGQNENGDTAWIHRAHIRRLKPRPAHLSHIPPHCTTLTKTLRAPRLYPLSSRIISHRTPYRIIYPHKYHKMKQNECL